jgi:acyl transferase domain-containing protein
MACQSLISGECDLALAGGVSLKIPQQAGYMYEEEGILSPDGHCRAFDARARGTVGGSGVGVVVLKRLGDALNDRDFVHAVIRGSAMNNDGSARIGYTAPGIEGQARVIAEAQAVARVAPEQITCIETHGTGTALGDPIEVAALRQAFGSRTWQQPFCALGSLKTNIGHLDAAAGVAGLIKMVLALEHQLLPPLLHFEQPNPRIDFAGSPFYINTTLSEWKTKGGPRLAGVSSFGIGGTNAHVILQEAPPIDGGERPCMDQLLIFSAKTETALQDMSGALARHLRQHPELALADVAGTLQVGRRHFEHRRMLVCHDLADAVEALETLQKERVFTAHQPSPSASVIFMFPGQGAQHVWMAQELYQREPVFREQVDLCAELLAPQLGLDIRHVLYPQYQQDEDGLHPLTATALAQPALFLIEYALARLLMSWGVSPQAMIGHSVGEYVAACLAGVFSLAEGLSMIAARGRMMQELPGGAMLAVPLAEQALRPFLAEPLSLAAVNGPAHCVVAGPGDAIDRVQQQLAQQGVHCQLLHTSHAFHSSMLAPVAEPFAQCMKKVHLLAPGIPFVSGRTGTWITPEEATDPQYWVQQMLQTVHFARGVSLLLQDSERILLEVGPGQTLGKLARQQATKAGRQKIFSLLPAPHTESAERAAVLTAVGHLWLEGGQIDWPAFSAQQSWRRLPLPTYPYERRRYWLDTLKTEGTQAYQKGAAPFAVSEDPGANGVNTREISMVKPQAFSAPHAAQQASIESMLAALLGSLLGVDLAEIETTATFLEMGADSLLLLQASQVIRDRFGVNLRFRQMLEEYATVADLAAYIVREAPLAEGSVDQPVPLAALPQPATLPAVRQPAHQALSNGRPVVPSSALPYTTVPGDGRALMGSSGLEQIIERQLQVMSQQLETLRALSISSPGEEHI